MLLLFSHSVVWLLATLWTAARQASLSFTISWSLLRLMSIELLMPSNHVILCRPRLLLPSVFSQHQGLFQWVGSLHQVVKYWSFTFSFSPSNEYSGLIPFRVDWLDHPRDFQESSPTPQFKSINSLALSLLYGLVFTSVHDYWKNHSFDYSEFFQKSDVSAF